MHTQVGHPKSSYDNLCCVSVLDQRWREMIAVFLQIHRTASHKEEVSLPLQHFPVVRFSKT